MESLQELFSKRKDEFKLKISSIKGNAVNSYLEELLKNIYNETNDLLGDNGTYRRQLTTQEDIILTRAMNLILVQQDFLRISTTEIDLEDPGDKNKVKGKLLDKRRKKREVPIGLALAGSMVSGVLNMNLIWQLCIPIVAYIGGELMVGVKNVENKDSHVKQAYQLSNAGIEKIIEAVESLYKNIDYLMECFKIQTEKIKNEYSAREKPFEVKYRTLLEKISNLIGTIKYSTEKADEAIVIETKMLEKELKNMDIEFLFYPNEIAGKTLDEVYDFIYNYEVKDTTPIYPAVVKGNTILVKGRVDKVVE